MSPLLTPRRAALTALLGSLILSGCMGDPAIDARIAAQPDTRPMRNVTSFTESLTCMDDLLAVRARRSVIISSSDIPDDTKKIAVGADDMLVHAFSMMNRKSRAYVFLDQVRSRADGAIDMMIADSNRSKEPRPQFYIRGSISQLDGDVDVKEAGLILVDGTEARTRIGGLSKSRKLSVVSVDLHLVEYANRQVVPGASVSNSMVVVNTGNRGDTAGIVEMGGFNLTLRVDRVESQSQAIRNLIELGLIELIGRHAGVPFERCLAGPQTDPAVQNEHARLYAETDPARLVQATRVALFVLGYLPTAGTGGEDADYTRALAAFQVDENLIASGALDLDTDTALRRRLAGAIAQSNAAIAQNQSPP